MKTNLCASLLLVAAGRILAGVTSGYTLIPVGSTTNLIDDAGKTVKTWNVGGYTAYLTNSGTLLAQTGSGSAAAMGFASLVEKTDANTGNVQKNIWTTSGFHHGNWLMPNGHWLGTVAVKINPKTALASAGYTGSLASIWDERIQEWDPVTKTVVWEWKASDHTSGTNHPRKFNSNTLFKSNDPIHINSVVYDSARDLVVMSSHYMNELLVVDHSTTTAQAATSTGGKYGKGGDFLFRWGSTKNYGGSGAAYSDVVHGGGVIQAGLPGAGNFSLFGNTDNTVKHSRWYEITGTISDTGFVIGSNGEFEAKLAWDFYSASGTFESSGHYGYGQRMPNGNTFLTFSGSNKLIEVDANKTILDTVAVASSGGFGMGGCIRAIRYPMGHPALVALGLSTASVETRMHGAAFALKTDSDRLVATGLTPDSRLRIFDAKGTLRYDGRAPSNRMEISTRAWPNGTYVLQATGSGTPASKTFALTH